MVPRPTRLRVTREVLVVAGAMALVYLLTMTGNHREAEDSLAYAAGIRSGGAVDVLNQNHLAWGAIGWAFYNGARGLGIADSPLVPLQVLDALLGAAGLGLLWRFLRVGGWSLRETAGACGLLAFSYGYWFYSGEAEVYILSALSLIVCLLLAHRAALDSRPLTFGLLGAANGFAVLAHDTNVLFAFVAAAALVLAAQRDSVRAAVRGALAYAGGAVAVVVPAYAGAAAALGFGSFREFWDWLTAYTGRGRWGHIAAEAIPQGVVGAGRALVGSHFLFALDPGRTLEPIGGGDQGQQLYLMRDYPDVVAVILIPLGLAALALVVAALVARLRDRPWRERDAATTLDLLCLAWLVPYTLFFLYWEPLNAEFWIAWWVPVAILAGRRLAAWDARRRHVLLAVLGTLAVVNLAGSILPQKGSGGDLWRARVTWYEHHARASDLVLANGYVFTNYVRYFTPATAIDAEESIAPHADDPGAGVFEIQSTMANSPATRFLTSTQALFPARGRYADCAGSEGICDAARVLRPHFLPGARAVAHTPLDTFWVLPRPRPGT
jgi:hypothetical protein